MYAEPTASRGSNKKKSAKGAVAAASQGGGPSPTSKKELQRTTKAQRKIGGLTRGGNYEVEAVGEMFMTDVKAAPKELPSSEEEEEEEEQLPDEAEACLNSAAFSPKPRTRASASTSGAKCLPPEAGVDEEEMNEIEADLREQLRGWAFDPGLVNDEKKRLVRNLLAQWHPDKNQHIGSVATRVFQFIQEEVNGILAEFSAVTDKAVKKEVEYKQRQAQRATEKSAKAAAVQSVKEDKRKKKQARAGEISARRPLEGHEEEEEKAEQKYDEKVTQEWALVIGHGPATTVHLRPWPRSHLTLVQGTSSRGDDLVLFGGEAYDGRELTFYSDLYRLHLHGADPSRPLPWEKIYSSVPAIPGPEARSSHQAVTWGRYLYIFGGEWSSRDQRHYRQFGDFWRIDATGGPGTRWERVEAVGASPSARSGHRMAVAADGRAVLFGGFTEDKRRKATYLDDLHSINLSETSPAWSQAKSKSRSSTPSIRAGCLLWMVEDATYVLGGSHPRRKAADSLITLEDLWRARIEASSPEPVVHWEKVQAQGEGPGPRSGMCHTAVSASLQQKRLVFGGVEDVRLNPGSSGNAKLAGAKELSIFHQDIFLLDCSAEGGPMWSRLWPKPGADPGLGPSLDLAALPDALQKKGGGTDALAVIDEAAGEGEPGSSQTPNKPSIPRGRMAASCAVFGEALWIFGGACESGPKREVTLDDFWRLGLSTTVSDAGVACDDDWECLLPLSDRATMWFESESESDEEEEEEEEPEAGHETAILPVENKGGGVLSKKQQHEANKKARMELKRERQEEKCEEKTSKRDQKRDKQRQQALEKKK